MTDQPEYNISEEFAESFVAAVKALPVKNTSRFRAVRRDFSRKLKTADPAFVLNVARYLVPQRPYRWLAYEFILHHEETFKSLDGTVVEELGQGLDSWHSVDSFARGLSGPAWLRDQISDEVILRWAHSPDFWWRRAALVSTVALNMRSQGGNGDVLRTLTVCGLLTGDHEDMVVKGLSWALRELVYHDPDAVRAFLKEHEAELAARIRREVTNKLETGLKNPRRKRGE